MDRKPALKARLSRYYWFAVMMGFALFVSAQPVFASTTPTGNIWTTFSTVMQDIYGQLLGISTILAVTAASVALIVRMVSRMASSAGLSQRIFPICFLFRG